MLNKIKIGIDEAGRGPWLGPIVACALCFNSSKIPDKKIIEKLDDSKKLSEKNREVLFDYIVNSSCFLFGVGVVDNFIIDEINIKQANKEAMRRAIVELLRKIQNTPSLIGRGLGGGNLDILIDGNDNYTFIELDKKPIYIIGGDTKILEISAASIVAKVFRDRLIKTYASIYPNLGLENHKGYGTKKHIEYLTGKDKITGIHRLSYKPVKKIFESKPKLLLHICCGPDACIPIIDLKKDYEVICFWYDPNIQPKKEYNKRLEHFKKVCEIEKVEYIEGEYDVLNFFEKIKGLEDTKERGDKCTKCYDMRLERTAIEARKLGIKYWTSTLNTSPHKDLEKLFIIGDNYSLKDNLEFLKIAFRKNNGFKRSVEYTKKHNIYRQNYCGCIYSDTYPGKNSKGKSFSG